MTLTATADLNNATSKIEVETNYRSKDAVKSIPGARWDQEKRIWTLPKNWASCLALRAEYGSGLTLGDEIRAWAADVAERKGMFLDQRSSIAPLFDMPVLPGFDTLFEHQQSDANLVYLSGGNLLNLNETGTGKTRSIAAGLSLMDNAHQPIWPVLVVAPKSVVINWGRELEPIFPDRTISIVQGTPSKKRKALEPGFDIYIIGWDALRTYSRLAPFGSVKLTDAQKTPKELNALGFHTVVFDEIHRAKDCKSQRTRAAWAVSDGAYYRIGLTGTPIQETPADMFGILRCVFPQEYPTKTPFMERFIDSEWNMWGGLDIKGLKEDRKPEFFKNFDSLSRRLTKEVVLPFLPDKLYTQRWVELPPKLRKAYTEMKNTYRAELEDSTMKAENAMVAAGRLIQLANSSGDMDADGKFKMSLPSPKIEAFLEDVEEGDFAGLQVVVFSDSRELADLLVDEMTKKKLSHVVINGDVTGDDRQAAIDTFQAGDADFCILTRAGGEGITLTAAKVMVRLTRPWSFTVHTQVEDRVHRIGSEKHDKILYVDYLTHDTVEIGQMKRLDTKGASAQEVLRDDELLEMLT